MAPCHQDRFQGAADPLPTKMTVRGREPRGTGDDPSLEAERHLCPRR